jgi:hypothetical protein
MNRIRRYVPSFVSGVDEEEFDFETLDDLLNIPFVRSSMEIIGIRFKRHYKSDNALMVEYDNGQYYVLGFIKHPELVDLPIKE